MTKHSVSIPSMSNNPIGVNRSLTKKVKYKMARQKSDSFSRKVSFYNDNFELVDDKAEGKIVSAKNLDEAKELFGNDEQKILDALNSQLRAEQIQNAIMAKTGGLEERFILGFIKPMRLTEPFCDMPNTNAKEEKAVVKAILEQVKAVPFLLNSLKSYCKTRAAEDSTEESE